jgi:flagellum-specific peptidoglycan hydrolase FlgJ
MGFASLNPSYMFSLHLSRLQLSFPCGFGSHEEATMATAAQTAFIKAAAKAAQKSEEETGVPASITIAQAILESGWGKHHLGDANNYFGIKAQQTNGKITFGDIATGFVDFPTKEFKNGKGITVVAHFRAYKDIAGSFVDHGLFLRSNPRYRKAIDAYAEDKDADEFAVGLQKAGYATDPNYAKSLIALMKKFDLEQFNAT